MTYGHCKDCIFWRNPNNGERQKGPAKLGRCQMHSPVAAKGTTSPHWAWTNSTDGCGDFQEATK